MTPLVFSLPWPPTRLSPNTRQHWRTLATAKKKYRQACFISVREQRVCLAFHTGARLTIEYQFCPPDKRAYDQDNLVARMKAGQDGVADALLIDDKLFNLGAPQMGAVQKDGCVFVRLTKVTA